MKRIEEEWEVRSSQRRGGGAFLLVPVDRFDGLESTLYTLRLIGGPARHLMAREPPAFNPDIFASLQALSAETISRQKPSAATPILR